MGCFMSIRVRFYFLAAVILAAGVLSSFFLTKQAEAAAGTLDLSFGNGGKVLTDIAQSNDEANGVAIQSDGKIVVVGSSSLGSISDFAVLRYNTNGTLDATFGNGGKVTTDFNNQSDVATAVAIQRDGKIVVAGRTSSQNQISFALARYNRDGLLDNSFHGNGKLIADFGGRLDSANAIVV